MKYQMKGASRRRYTAKGTKVMWPTSLTKALTAISAEMKEPIMPTAKKGMSAAAVSYTHLDVYKRQLYSRPDLIVAQKSVAVAFKDVHIAMGEFLPRVDASYDDMRYSRDFDDRRYNDYTRNYWAAGINFTWDVFSGGSAVFNTLAERNRAKALQKDFEDAMAGARTDVIRAMLDMDAAKELITTTRYGVDSARENYAMSQKRYMTNIGTITDLVDAQVRLTEAERDASQALADYHSCLLYTSRCV